MKLEEHGVRMSKENYKQNGGDNEKYRMLGFYVGWQTFIDVSEETTAPPPTPAEYKRKSWG
jgi:hypothetical protein